MRSAGGVALCALAAAAGGAVALTRESYAMVCEVAQSCAVPVLDDGSSRGDLQGVHTHTFEVDEHSTTSFSSDQMMLRTSLIERRAFNATAVGQWLITYTSGSGERFEIAAAILPKTWTMSPCRDLTLDAL